jgi:hypothetical protein
MFTTALFASRRGTLRGQRAWARTKVFMRENREVPWSPAGVYWPLCLGCARGGADRAPERAVRGTLWR